MTESMLTMIENIKRKLAQIERTPSWLARKTKIRHPNLHKLLNGQGNASLKTLDTFAKALECDPNELLTKPQEPSIDLSLESNLEKN